MRKNLKALPLPLIISFLIIVTFLLIGLVGLGRDIFNASEVGVIVGKGLRITVEAILLYFLLQGSRVARTLYTVLIPIRIAIIDISLYLIGSFDLLLEPISVIWSCLDIAAVLLLYKKSSGKWFEKTAT